MSRVCDSCPHSTVCPPCIFDAEVRAAQEASCAARMEERQRKEHSAYRSALVEICHSKVANREAKVIAARAMGWKKWGWGDTEQSLDDE